MTCFNICSGLWHCCHCVWLLKRYWKLPKWHGTKVLNGEVKSLIIIISPLPISLPSLARPSCALPLSFCTTSPCSLLPVTWVSCKVLERLCFLLSQGLGSLYSLSLMPHLFSPLSSGITSTGEGFPVREACPSSCPNQVFCYTSSKDSIVFLQSASLSM